MKYIIACLIVIVFSCTKKEDFELEIINKEIKSIKLESISTEEYLKNNLLINQSKTIITYKLTNNTSKTYFFSLNRYNEEFNMKYIRVDRIYINIFNENNLNIKHKSSYPTFDSNPARKLTKEYEILNQLNYPFLFKFNNFIIHPNETLYFEWFVMLPKGNEIEFPNNRVDLDSSKKYFAQIMLKSDSTNYKNFISRTELKTIQENGYEVYDGIIKSKNKVPIKFVDIISK